MPGICPNCVELVQTGDTCPRCKGPLISTQQWSRDKQQFLAGREPAPIDNAPRPPVDAEPGVPHFGLRFFAGALASIAAFLAILIITLQSGGG